MTGPTQQAGASGVKRPIVGLVGPWISNRGDELMLHAVLQRLAGQRLSIPTELWNGPRPHGLRPVALPPGSAEVRLAVERRDGRRLLTLGAKAVLTRLPGSAMARLSGFGDAREIDVLLDCSGFAYGDDWSAGRMHRRADYFAALAAGRTRIVMLPQAFGPFEKPEIRAAARRLLSTCTLAFARDADSLAHLGALDLPRDVPRLSQAPDITHLLDVSADADDADRGRRVVIVPNARMLDRTSAARAAVYEAFLNDAISAATSAGLEPCLMVHEDNDRALVQRLARAGGGLAVLEGSGPRLKRDIGSARLVVASRFHALVSALSQGVPAIGTSWSHKYARLFEEYGHSEFLMAPEAERSDVKDRCAWLLSDEGQTEVRARLRERASVHRVAVAAMWQEVEAVAGLRG